MGHVEGGVDEVSFRRAIFSRYPYEKPLNIFMRRTAHFRIG
jgi:hypothetical protein